VLETVEFDWLKEVYESANATVSNDKLEDVINLLKLISLSEKCGLTELHYSLKNPGLRDLLHDSNKIDANTDKDNIIFTMSEFDYKEAVDNPTSMLQNNVFRGNKEKFSVWLQGKLNQEGTEFKVYDTIFKIKGNNIDVDGKDQVIQYSSKDRYINLGS
jgi:hypothetical protein